LVTLGLASACDPGDEPVADAGVGPIHQPSQPGADAGGSPVLVGVGQDATSQPSVNPARDAGTQPGPSDAAVAASDATSGSGSAGGWCKVQPVFAKYCTACHDGAGTASTPMGLKSYADLSADSAAFPGSKIYQRVGVRMHATTKPMPPQDQVSAADLKAIDDWIAAGAPAGASTECGAAPNPGDGGAPAWPADCEEHYEFRANAGGKTPFTVAAGREFYQDFTFPAPWSGDVQAVAFRNITDNKKVIHHWILYQGANSFLIGWSPGKNDKDLPPDVGVHMPASGTLKLTAHYYNTLAGAKAEQDASGVEVCVTKKKRAKTAFTFPFTATPNIPANSQMTVNAATCTVTASAPVHLITSSPHMHKLGIHAKFEITRTNGMVEVVHDLPFNFEEQTTRPIDVQLNNGDKVKTTCVYRNTTNKAVSFGQNTDQEMCFNFALYYPMCGMTCASDDMFANAISQSQGAGCPR
jgi:hypothetical protein